MALRSKLFNQVTHATNPDPMVPKIIPTHLWRELSSGDRQAALYLLNSIRKSPEDWNYLAIFALSLAAIALDLLLRANKSSI
jgi:hypothetical protein